MRRDCEPVVHRPALIGFDVPEADPSQRLRGQDLRDPSGHEWEHLAQTGVEQQRLVGGDEVLIEADGSTDERGELVDAVGDLGDAGLHQNGTSWVSRPLAVARPDSVRQNSIAPIVMCSPVPPDT